MYPGLPSRFGAPLCPGDFGPELNSMALGVTVHRRKPPVASQAEGMNDGTLCRGDALHVPQGLDPPWGLGGLEAV
jgi:hypothetical protein